MAEVVVPIAGLSVADIAFPGAVGVPLATAGTSSFSSALVSFFSYGMSAFGFIFHPLRTDIVLSFFLLNEAEDSTL